MSVAGKDTVRVRWLPEALADFERLHAFLKNKSPDAAARAAGTIWTDAKQLQLMPKLGRALDDDTGRRELFLPFGASAYVLRYKLPDPSTVVVIRIWHSREERS